LTPSLIIMSQLLPKFVPPGKTDCKTKMRPVRVSTVFMNIEDRNVNA